MSQTQRYSALSIGMHWLMLLLIVGVYVCINVREIYPEDSPGFMLFEKWHFMLGLSIFVLVWIRLLGRALGTTPAILPEPPAWEKLLSKVIHLVLYLLMLGMPLLGWLLLSAEGEAIPFFGMELPALVNANESLAHTIKEIHEFGGNLGYFLIGLHAVAALYHHYFKRDNTLVRMLPGRD